MFAEGLAARDQVDAALEEAERTTARAAAARARQQAANAATADGEHLVRGAEASLQVAEAREAVAAATEQQAAATLDKTFVRAPFDGIVVLKDAEVGEVVSPNSQGGSTARGSVCTMVDFASLEVQADVPETNIADVVIGAAADIYLDAYPDRVYRGRVSRIWPTANRQKASIEVRVVFTQRDRDLRPEMGVRVVFLPTAVNGAATGTGNRASTPAIAKAGAKEILVPADAIVEVAGKPGVFLVERDTVRFQPVITGGRRAGRVTISSGLQPGKRIVLAPPPDLSDGDRILVLD
jgi:RND family efflux transporter MFP subunit